jgi:SAM-dependent methyltransferase
VNKGSSFVPALGFHRFTGLYEPIVRRWLVAKRIRNAVVAEVHGRQEMRILDLGAGPGRLAIHLKLAFPTAEVHTVDADPFMVTRTRHNAKIAGVTIDAHCGDMTSALSLGQFDCVVSTMTFHHLDRAAKTRAFAVARQSMKADGKFVVVDFAPPRGCLQWALFRFVQQPLDGFENTEPHADGRFSQMIHENFASVRLAHTWHTAAGTIAMSVCNNEILQPRD